MLFYCILHNRKHCMGKSDIIVKMIRKPVILWLPCKWVLWAQFVHKPINKSHYFCNFTTFVDYQHIVSFPFTYFFLFSRLLFFVTSSLLNSKKLQFECEIIFLITHTVELRLLLFESFLQQIICEGRLFSFTKHWINGNQWKPHTRSQKNEISCKFYFFFDSTCEWQKTKCYDGKKTRDAAVKSWLSTMAELSLFSIFLGSSLISSCLFDIFFIILVRIICINKNLWQQMVLKLKFALGLLSICNSSALKHYEIFLAFGVFISSVIW